MTHLSVNLNAVAMLRNRRSVPWPSVTGIARIALDAGADGITVHPRPDERHIRRTDVFELVSLLRQDYAGREFNIEGYPTEDFLTLVERAAPDQVTFVPDDPLQSTSDHGWNIEANRAVLTPAIERMKTAGGAGRASRRAARDGRCGAGGRAQCALGAGRPAGQCRP